MSRVIKFQRISQKANVMFIKGTQTPIENIGTWFLPNECQVKEGKKLRTMRFLRSADTIWKDEQIKAGIPEKVEFQPTDKIAFQGDTLYVAEENEPLMLEYLRMSDWNRAKEGRNESTSPQYFEVDFSKQNKLELDRIDYLDSLKRKVKVFADKDEVLRSIGSLLMCDVNGTNSDIVLQLYKKIDTIPSQVEGVLNMYSDDVYSVIDNALSTGTITENALGYSYPDGTKIKAWLKEERGTNKNRKRFAEWLGTQEGLAQLEAIKNQITAKRAELITA